METKFLLTTVLAVVFFFADAQKKPNILIIMAAVLSIFVCFLGALAIYFLRIPW